MISNKHLNRAVPIVKHKRTRQVILKPQALLNSIHSGGETDGYDTEAGQQKSPSDSFGESTSHNFLSNALQNN